MKRWNRTYRGKNRPTDVLSFRFNGSSSYLGDIAISPAIARSNAVANGRTLQNELRILILHGVLHLLGFDHEKDRGEMVRKEDRLRRKLGIA